jgi:hypothetical protein
MVEMEKIKSQIKVITRKIPDTVAILVFVLGNLNRTPISCINVIEVRIKVPILNKFLLDPE